MEEDSCPCFKIIYYIETIISGKNTSLPSNYGFIRNFSVFLGEKITSYFFVSLKGLNILLYCLSRPLQLSKIKLNAVILRCVERLPKCKTFPLTA